MSKIWLTMSWNTASQVTHIAVWAMRGCLLSLDAPPLPPAGAPASPSEAAPAFR